MYAIKFQSENPEKPQGMPDQWPWQYRQIAPEQAPIDQQFGWTIMSANEFTAHLAQYQQAFDEYWANRSGQRSRFKVLDLIDPAFANLPIDKIDFTIHLKRGVVLNKKTTMLMNGRPEKAEYFNGQDKICEIKFTFKVNLQNFMTERIEELGYVKGDDEIPFYFPIKHKIFDMSNFSDKAEVVEERVEARQYIMKEIKSVLNDVLGLYYIMLPPPSERKTPQELWTMAGEFWTVYSNAIDSWFNTASDELKVKISADTEFAFLDLIVPTNISQEADAKSVRQYIIGRITY